MAADQRERVAVAVELGYRERERWDCESVLGLRSNLDNHPGQIAEPAAVRRMARGSGGSGSSGETAIRLDARGVPLGVLPPRSSAAAVTATAAAVRTCSGTAEDGKAEEQGVVPWAQERRKGETVDEKRARKAAVKEAKRNARANKKEMKQLWRGEAQRAAQRAATAQPQAAIKLLG